MNRNSLIDSISLPSIRFALITPNERRNATNHCVIIVVANLCDHCTAAVVAAINIIITTIAAGTRLLLLLHLQTIDSRGDFQKQIFKETEHRRKVIPKFVARNNSGRHHLATTEKIAASFLHRRRSTRLHAYHCFRIDDDFCFHYYRGSLRRHRRRHCPRLLRPTTHLRWRISCS